MRSHRPVPSLALCTLLAATTTRGAWAGPADPPAAPAASAGADEQAARQLRAGNKAFKEGDFAGAERAYREAFALKRGYDIAGNLGAAELSLGKLRECAQHLAFTLRLFPITGEPALREQMARAFGQCRRGVGAVRVEVTGAGGPIGATVLVDGLAAGEAPLLDEVFVEPGAHVIEARLDGYAGASQRVSVDRGSAAAVTLALTPLPAPPATIVQVVAARRRSLAPGLALAIAGAVGLGGGAAFISLSASKRTDAAGQAGSILTGHGSCVPGAGNYDAARCPGLQSTLRADDAFHDVAVGAFVAGGAALAGAAAYFLWPQRRPSSGPDLRVTPVVGAGSGGAIFSGSF